MAGFVRAPVIAPSDQLEGFEKQSIEKANPAQIKQLLGQGPAGVAVAGASDGDFRSQHHKQSRHWIHLTKDTGNGCDRAPEKKTGKKGNCQERQSSPGVLSPGVEQG